MISRCSLSGRAAPAVAAPQQDPPAPHGNGCHSPEGDQAEGDEPVRGQTRSGDWRAAGRSVQAWFIAQRPLDQAGWMRVPPGSHPRKGLPTPSCTRPCAARLAVVAGASGGVEERWITRYVLTASAGCSFLGLRQVPEKINSNCICIED